MLNSRSQTRTIHAPRRGPLLLALRLCCLLTPALGLRLFALRLLSLALRRSKTRRRLLRSFALRLLSLALCFREGRFRLPRYFSAALARVALGRCYGHPPIPHLLLPGSLLCENGLG